MLARHVAELEAFDEQADARRASMKDTQAAELALMRQGQEKALADMKAAQSAELSALQAQRNAALSIVEAAIARELEDERVKAQLTFDIRKAGGNARGHRGGSREGRREL